MREGYIQTTLQEVCSKTSNIKWQDYLNKTFEYIDLSSVSRESLIITETTPINSVTAPSRAKQIIFENDVIFATTRPTLKRVTLVTSPYHNQICSTGFCVLRANKILIEAKLIKYFIQSESFMNRMQSLERGASYPAVSDKDVFEATLIIPKSLQEQKQIVAILDQAFKAIDQAKANIEKNIANAKELFQSKLNAIFSQKGDGWEEKSLGEIADVNYGYTDKSTSEGDFRYVRITDIDNNGELDKTGKVYIKSTPEALNFILKENDLLMARTGATFAKVLLYKDYEPSIFASYLIKISFKVNIINELYLYFTKSGYYWEQANNLSSGSAQPHFNGAALKKVIFSYPLDSSEQQRLIEIIKGFDNTKKEIISLYLQKLHSLEELKKSILQKAFTGELTNKEETEPLQQVAEPTTSYSKN